MPNIVPSKVAETIIEPYISDVAYFEEEKVNRAMLHCIIFKRIVFSVNKQVSDDHGLDSQFDGDAGD